MNSAPLVYQCYMECFKALEELQGRFLTTVEMQIQVLSESSNLREEKVICFYCFDLGFCILLLQVSNFLLKAFSCVIEGLWGRGAYIQLRHCYSCSSANFLSHLKGVLSAIDHPGFKKRPNRLYMIFAKVTAAVPLWFDFSGIGAGVKERLNRLCMITAKVAAVVFPWFGISGLGVCVSCSGY